MAMRSGTKKYYYKNNILI